MATDLSIYASKHALDDWLFSHTQNAWVNKWDKKEVILVAEIKALDPISSAPVNDPAKLNEWLNTLAKARRHKR